MPSPQPLPAELRGRPFLLEEALRLGVTRRRLAGSRFRRIFRRVYVGAEVPDSVELRCRAAALVLPAHMVFCGFTAALLYRIPVPPDGRTHVALPAGTARGP